MCSRSRLKNTDIFCIMCKNTKFDAQKVFYVTYFLAGLHRPRVELNFPDATFIFKGGLSNEHPLCLSESHSDNLGVHRL